MILVAAVVAANMCVAGNQGYWDGVADGAAIGVWTGIATVSVYVGCFNDLGATSLFFTGDIIALGIKKGPALTAAQVAEAAAAMAAL